MKLNSQNISELIAKANYSSTVEAEKLHLENYKTGKLKPIFNSKIKFISSFLKNRNKFKFKDRIVYSCIASLSELLKNLKLLKLNKII